MEIVEESKHNFRSTRRIQLTTALVSCGSVASVLPDILAIIADYAVAPFGVFFFQAKSSDFLDLETGQVTGLAEVPVLNLHQRAVRVANSIYLLDVPHHRVAACYNTVTNSWSIPEDRHPHPRRVQSLCSNSCVVGLDDDRIAVIGGGQITDDTLKWSTVYDARSQKWVVSDSMTDDRSDAASATLNGKIYVFGGFDYKTRESCEAYDPVTGKWKRIAPLPSPLSRAKAVVVNETTILVLGGGFEAVSSTSTVVYEYNPLTNVWRILDWHLPRAFKNPHVAYNSESQILYVADFVEQRLYSKRLIDTPAEWTEQSVAFPLPHGTCFCS